MSFRPLAGIMVLIDDLTNDFYRGSFLGFRPLAGIMVLISPEFGQVRTLTIDVSVPLRGLWFLSNRFVRHIALSFRILSFPSPCGDYGSYQNMKMLILRL